MPSAPRAARLCRASGVVRSQHRDDDLAGGAGPAAAHGPWCSSRDALPRRRGAPRMSTQASSRAARLGAGGREPHALEGGRHGGGQQARRVPGVEERRRYRGRELDRPLAVVHGRGTARAAGLLPVRQQRAVEQDGHGAHAGALVGADHELAPAGGARPVDAARVVARDVLAQHGVVGRLEARAGGRVVDVAHRPGADGELDGARPHGHVRRAAEGLGGADQAEHVGPGGQQRAERPAPAPRRGQRVVHGDPVGPRRHARPDALVAGELVRRLLGQPQPGQPFVRGAAGLVGGDQEADLRRPVADHRVGRHGARHAQGAAAGLQPLGHRWPSRPPPPRAGPPHPARRGRAG